MPVTEATTINSCHWLACFALPDCRAEFARRIGMRAVADHDIQHDHGDFGVTRFLQQAADAQIVVDHRVRAADGELLFAQIDTVCLTLCSESASWFSCFSGAFESTGSVQHVAPDHLRFVAQRAARE